MVRRSRTLSYHTDGGCKRRRVSSDNDSRCRARSSKRDALSLISCMHSDSDDSIEKQDDSIGHVNAHKDDVLDERCILKLLIWSFGK